MNDRLNTRARLLTLMLLLCGLGYAVADNRVVVIPLDGNSAPSTGRLFYLTLGTQFPQEFFLGSQATTACDPGFHMASMYELVTGSNLIYDHTRGVSVADSGEGPPTSLNYPGWVRTGNFSNSGSVPGQANCNTWTSSNSTHDGSTLYIEVN